MRKQKILWYVLEFFWKFFGEIFLEIFQKFFGNKQIMNAK
jgi:hypothetical protein